MALVGMGSRSKLLGWLAWSLVTGMLVGAFGVHTIAQPDTTTPPAAEANHSLNADEPDVEVDALPKPDHFQVLSPLDLVKAPNGFLTQGVEFEGTFHSFATLGLDYKPAFRKSTQYISILMLRPDVAHHAIPLSELKLFYPRKNSEAILALESGDEIRVQGQVFSDALGDPWIDALSIDVIKKADKPDKD